MLSHNDCRFDWLILVQALRRVRLCWLGCGDAFHDDAFGFEMGDAVVGAVTHVDRLLEKGDERAGGFGKPAVGGLVPVDREVVGGVAFRAGKGCFQPAMKGAGGEFADGFGAGADGCYAKVHFGQGSTVVAGLGGCLTLNDSANQMDECGMKERSHFA